MKIDELPIIHITGHPLDGHVGPVVPLSCLPTQRDAKTDPPEHNDWVHVYGTLRGTEIGHHVTYRDHANNEVREWIDVWGGVIHPVKWSEFLHW